MNIIVVLFTNDFRLFNACSISFRLIYLSYCLVCSLQPCGLLLGKGDLLALLCVSFSCVFVTFPYGILDQVWYLIVSIPDLCILPYLI